MDGAREEFEAAGVSLVLIGQATPRHAKHFRKRQGISVPVLADEQRDSYKAAGAKVGSVSELLGPKVFAKGLATIASTGKIQGRTIGHPAQLGATGDGSLRRRHHRSVCHPRRLARPRLGGRTATSPLRSVVRRRPPAAPCTRGSPSCARR